MENIKNNGKQPNPFKELATSHIPPDNLKDKVLSSARISYLLIHTLDLFFNKPLAAISSLFKTNDE
jgi:hypothetical protein